MNMKGLSEISPVAVLFGKTLKLYENYQITEVNFNSMCSSKARLHELVNWHISLSLQRFM